MDWLLICPRCACAVESFARLRAVLRRFRCPECHNEYEAAMDDFIAIYFTVSPQICAIRYHRPETLDPFDYMFGFKGVREGRRPDGQPYVDSVRSALRGHRRFLEPAIPPASRSRPRRARCRDQLGHGAGFVLQVGAEPDRPTATAAPDLSRHRLSAGARPRWPRGRSRSRSRTRPRAAAFSPSSRFPPARRTSCCTSIPTLPASTCSPARPSGACSVPRWWAAPRASRSATSRSCSRTSGARPLSTSGSAT